VPTTSAKTYGADPLLLGFWLALVSIPVPIAVWLVLQRGLSNEWQILLASLIPPGLTLAFTSRFRACFTEDAFIYRRWGPTVRVAYREIASIEVANSTRLARKPIGAFLVTYQGERLPFWPKLFPRAAVERLLSLAPRV